MRQPWEPIEVEGEVCREEDCDWLDGDKHFDWGVVHRRTLIGGAVPPYVQDFQTINLPASAHLARFHYISGVYAGYPSYCMHFMWSDRS